ncbi:MAG: hypothetical protein AB1592_07210 [Pseudomonadota bacterium]
MRISLGVREAGTAAPGGKLARGGGKVNGGGPRIEGEVGESFEKAST